MALALSNRATAFSTACLSKCLRGHYINVLITDDATALYLLQDDA
jgi:DNA-binding transcriptional regulator LsrR (DeoR family)